MKYTVRIGDREQTLDVDGDRVRVGDREVVASLVDIDGTHTQLATIDGAVYRVEVTRGQGRGRYTLSLGGHTINVEALDERAHAIQELSKRSAKAAGPAPLVAPMPGLIVRVSVTPGDAVHAGQGLIVMEAMKMENELRAQADGTVKAVHVAPGTAVEKGTLLVELE